MANVRSSNTYHIDTQYSTSEELAEKSLSVTGIVMVSTGANAILVLSDSSTGTKKIELRLATSGETLHIPLDAGPIHFPNGIRPTTVTNCRATVILAKPGN